MCQNGQSLLGHTHIRDVTICHQATINQEHCTPGEQQMYSQHIADLYVFLVQGIIFLSGNLVMTCNYYFRDLLLSYVFPVLTLVLAMHNQHKRD